MMRIKNIVDLKTAIEYGKALEQYELKWFEEAGDPLDYHLNAELSKNYKNSLATGENLFSMQDSRNLIRYGEVGSLANKMLELLADNKRLNLIETINTSYQELLEQHNNTSSIVVNVANQPSEDNKKVIVEKLLAEHGEGSNIEFSEDPSIMGGLSIKVGDETLDLSIKGKVKKLVNQLNF